MVYEHLDRLCNPESSTHTKEKQNRTTNFNLRWVVKGSEERLPGRKDHWVLLKKKKKHTKNQTYYLGNIGHERVLEEVETTEVEIYSMRGFPGGAAAKNPPARASDEGLTPDPERCRVHGAAQPAHSRSRAQARWGLRARLPSALGAPTREATEAARSLLAATRAKLAQQRRPNTPKSIMNFKKGSEKLRLYKVIA